MTLEIISFHTYLAGLTTGPKLLAGFKPDEFSGCGVCIFLHKFFRGFDVNLCFFSSGAV